MRGNYLRALEPTLQAAKCMPQDAATMANAGSLVAWYEKSKPQPKVSPQVKSLIEVGKMGWSRTKQFADAYSSCGRQLGDLNKKAEKLADDASASKKKVESLTKEYRKLEDEYRKKYREGVNKSRDRERLWDELAGVERSLKKKKTGELLKKRDNLKKRINEANKKIDGLKKNVRDLREKGSKVGKELDAAQKAARTLGGQKVTAYVKLDFRRPGEDGKVASAAPAAKPKPKPKGKGKKK